MANGIEAKIGSITACLNISATGNGWLRESQWQMETLVKGTCTKANFLDIFENFILFDDSIGQTVKIVARNHQYLGVNAAFEAVQDRETRDGKLGVFWHTQGSGKSYSMVLFAQKVRRKLGGDFTFLILTDRQDLDNQIYKTFAGVGLADNDKDPCRAESGPTLKDLIASTRRLFSRWCRSSIRKLPRAANIPAVQYHCDDRRGAPDAIRHPSQKHAGCVAECQLYRLHRNTAFSSDEITRRVFGGYVSTYDFQRAIEDKATLPLYYDARATSSALPRMA